MGGPLCCQLMTRGLGQVLESHGLQLRSFIYYAFSEFVIMKYSKVAELFFNV